MGQRWGCLAAEARSCSCVLPTAATRDLPPRESVCAVSTWARTRCVPLAARRPLPLVEASAGDDGDDGLLGGGSMVAERGVSIGSDAESVPGPGEDEDSDTESAEVGAVASRRGRSCQTPGRPRASSDAPAPRPATLIKQGRAWRHPWRHGNAQRRAAQAVGGLIPGKVILAPWGSNGRAC